MTAVGDPVWRVVTLSGYRVGGCQESKVYFFNVRKENTMQKLLWILICAVILVGSESTFSSAWDVGVHIGIPLPSIQIGPPVILERRSYRRSSRRRYVRRYAQREVMVVQQDAPPPTIVEVPQPLPPPPPPPVTSGETVVETTVVEQPVVDVVWYQTNSVCCYVWFGNVWHWDTYQWYDHHFHGHYYERSPLYWSQYGYDTSYWSRYETGRRYVRDQRHWEIERRDHVIFTPQIERRFRPRFHSDNGRHLGWERREQRAFERHEFRRYAREGRQGFEHHNDHQREWERHGERHEKHGWGGGEGHRHGRGHGHD